jgi:hypothetical protein
LHSPFKESPLERCKKFSQVDAGREGTNPLAHPQRLGTSRTTDDLGGEVLGNNLLTSRQDVRPFQKISQLPYVSRERIGTNPFDRGWGYMLGTNLQLLRNLG